MYYTFISVVRKSIRNELEMAEFFKVFLHIYIYKYGTNL